MSFQNKLFKYESKLNNIQKGGSDLSDAIRANNLDEVRRLLSINPARVNEVKPDTGGMTNIFFARSVEMLKLLMEFKIDINIKDVKGNTVLNHKIRGLHDDVKVIASKTDFIYRLEYHPDEADDLNEDLDSSKDLLRYNISIVEFLIKNNAEYNIIQGDRENAENLLFRSCRDEIKAGVILPLLATQLEKFNISYIINGRNINILENIMQFYSIRPEEIAAVAGKMGADRRVHPLSALLAARDRRAAASAAAYASAPPPPSAAAAASAPPVASAAP